MRALDTGNLALIRGAAAELPQVPLDDALRICLLLRRSEPESYGRAAVRWLGRFCLEQPGATLHDLQLAVDAFESLPSGVRGRRLRYRRVGSHTKGETVRRFAITTLALASLGFLGVAPAHAVNHPFVPADECAESENAGGEIAFDNVSTAPGQPFVKRAEHNEGPQGQNNSQAPGNCN